VKCVAELAWKSAALYRKAGHPDSAAQVLERAGKMIEDQVVIQFFFKTTYLSPSLPKRERTVFVLKFLVLAPNQ
jgi:hypothetical protein